MKRNTVNFTRYYLYYHMQQAILFLVNLIISGISLYSFCIDLRSLNFYNISDGIIFLLSCFNLIYTFFTIRAEIKKTNETEKYEIEYIGIPEEIVFDKNQDNSVVVLKNNSKPIIIENENYLSRDTVGTAQCALFSKKLCHKITNDDLLNVKCSVDKIKRKKIHKYIISNKEEFFDFLHKCLSNSNAHGKPFVNEKKLCLQTDLQYILDGNIEKSISFYKGCYYDTYATSIITANKLIYNDNPSKIKVNGHLFYPIDSDNRLIRIDTSDFSNEIGISTLAITKDNYIVIVKQNNKNQSSSNLWAPTGSGSADWKDIKYGQTAYDVLAYAMQRELWEECANKAYIKNVRSIGETKIIGYFRWLNKSGKSEFIGITKVNYPVKCLESNTQENYELYTERISDESDKITKDNLLAAIYSLEEKPGVSLPLHMCMLFLKNCLIDSDKAICEFLNIQNT